MRGRIVVGALVFGAGVLVGVFSRPEINDMKTDGLGWSRPAVATLMSPERSMVDVNFVLNRALADSMEGQFHVFEAMIFDPNVKGPELAFWTNERGHAYGELDYFPVDLGTDVTPRSLAAARVPPDTILVLRYLARLRKTSRATYYLEHHTLLGYAYISTEAAQELTKKTAERPQ